MSGCAAPRRERHASVLVLSTFRPMLLLVAGVLTLFGCGGSGDTPPPPPPPPTVSTVNVTPDAGSVLIGATLQLAPTVLDGSGQTLANRSILWTSLAPEIATVTQTGLVTGVSSGSATITASTEGKTGAAAVVVAAPPTRSCDATEAISIVQEIGGTISRTDCRLSDGSFADKFALTLTDSTPTRITMVSGQVDSYLVLQDAATGLVVAENDDGNGRQDSRIEIMLQPGRYVLVVSTFDPGQFGAYTVNISRASRACVTSTTLVVPATIARSLSQTESCLRFDATASDRYLLTLARRSIITATMRSTVLNSFLFVEDLAGEVVAFDNNSGGGQDARIAQPLNAGSYFVIANGVNPSDTGRYTITVEARGDPCSADLLLAPDSAVPDTLSSASCVLADGSFAKRYRLRVSAPTALRLDMTSTQLDAYLIVQQAGISRNLVEDDDGGVGLNAQILRTFDAGEYVITATSARPAEVGTFTLTVSGSTGPNVSVTVAPTSLTMSAGQTQQLTATVTGSTNTNVAWQSTVPGIAAVSSTGLVRAITSGSANIIATSAADPFRTAVTSVLVNSTGTVNLDIPLAYLTQSVQSPDGRVPLIADRATVARVFVRGSVGGLGAAPVRVRFFNGSALLGTVTGIATAATVTDEGCCSADIPVPAALLRNGTTFIADVDPANTITETNETDNSYPLTGASKPVSVLTVPAINIQLVPIKHRGTGAVGPSTTTIADLLPRLHPVGRLNVTVHAEYTTDLPTLTDGTSWGAMLREIGALRTLEGSTQFYFGVLSQRLANGIVGIGVLGGFTGVGISGPDAFAQETFTHEFGHIFNRQHAPSPSCGAPANVDPNFPRPDGTIGVFGFDLGKSAIFGPGRFDVMGYCDDTWISIYTYLGVLDYLRSGTIPATQTVSAVTPVLLVSGSLINGVVEIDPVFSLTAAPTPSRTAGRYLAEGFASDGRLLFRHQFDGGDVPDIDAGAQSFAVKIPYDAATRGAVASLSVRDLRGGARPALMVRSGTYAAGVDGVSLRVDGDPQLRVITAAAGRVEIAWNPARYPAAVLRNRITGEVIGFARRGAMSMDAGTLDAAELMLSDGVSSISRRLSVGGAP
jgi:uncharacterized protein YjdB